MWRAGCLGERGMNTCVHGSWTAATQRERRETEGVGDIIGGTRGPGEAAQLGPCTGWGVRQEPQVSGWEGEERVS